MSFSVQFESFRFDRSLDLPIRWMKFGRLSCRIFRFSGPPPANLVLRRRAGC